jgi:multisubunit Na+/H+ antiporter MnhG subunit
MLNQQLVIIALSAFFFLSALGLIHLFEKSMDNAQTQILGLAMHTLG